jgi:hypothetical protein
MPEFAIRDVDWAGTPAIQLQGIQFGKPYAWLSRIYDGRREDAVARAIAAATRDGAEPCEVADKDWRNPNFQPRAVWTHESKNVQLVLNPKDKAAGFVLKKGIGSADLTLNEAECRSLAATLIECANHIKARNNG